LREGTDTTAKAFDRPVKQRRRVEDPLHAVDSRTLIKKAPPTPIFMKGQGDPRP